MKNIIICDLDGTLCDITHRLHHVEQSPKNWDAFFAGVLGDGLNYAVLEVLQLTQLTDDLQHTWNDLVLVSGRPERCRADTIQWLENNCSIDVAQSNEKPEEGYARLYMRKDGDFRPDHEVKQEILDSSIDKDRVLFVLDDRQQVVDMWRRNGLTCFQVAEGNF